MITEVFGGKTVLTTRTATANLSSYRLIHPSLTDIFAAAVSFFDVEHLPSGRLPLET
jgi:hypothetical protein